MIWNQVRLNALLNVIDFYDSMFSFSNNLKRNKDTKIIEVSQELFENVCSIKIDDKPLITVSTLEKLSDTTEFRNSRVTDLSQQ